MLFRADSLQEKHKVPITQVYRKLVSKCSWCAELHFLKKKLKYKKYKRLLCHMF